MDQLEPAGRIEAQRGKQARSPALGGRSGLTLSPTSSSADNSGLNAAGQALAEDLLLSQANSSNMATDIFETQLHIIEVEYQLCSKTFEKLTGEICSYVCWRNVWQNVVRASIVA